MRKGDTQLGTPQILYKDTKAAIEALSSVPEGAIAFATDTDQVGTYNGVTWAWAVSGTVDHNLLASLQGGTTNQYYHLTSAQNTDLTDSGDSTLHYHAADRVDANQTFTDVTTNDASTTKHGFLLKATAPTSGIRNVVAIDNGETVYKNTALLDTTNPADLAGTASPGTSLIAARRDHVHLGLTSTQLTDLTDGGQTVLHGHSSGYIDMPKLGTPVNDTLTEDFTARGSSGVIDGTLTYVTVGSTSVKISVAAGEGYIRTTNSQQGALYFCKWDAVADLYTFSAPAAGQENVIFIGIEYSAGNVTPVAKTAFTDWNWYTNFPLARASYDGTTMRILNAYAHAEDTANLTRKWMRLNFPFHREESPEGSGGLELSVSLRALAMTAGKIWHGFNNYSLGALASGVAFDTHYRRAGGGFNKTTGVTAFPNSQYDDGSGTLVTMSGASKLAVLWVYVDVTDGSLDVIYGRGEYNSVSAAQAEGIPTVPNHLSYHGRLIGRIIFQKAAASPTLVESAWAGTFNASAVGDHNLLTNLQGGAASDYYHFTSAQHTDLTDGGDSTLHYHAADRVDANQTFTDVTTNDASTTKHGFAPKATAPAANVLNVVGIANGETAYTNKSIFDSTNPANLGTAAPGTSLIAAHRDHVHQGREYLTATRTYYVRTDGSDSNTGLVDSAGGAFLTIQKAVDVAAYTLDGGGTTLIIRVGDGTYTGATVLRPLTGFGAAAIVGNSVTPTNVVISTTGNCFLATGIPHSWEVDYIKMTSSAGSCLVAQSGSVIYTYGCDYGAAVVHFYGDFAGRIIAGSNYTVSGNATYHQLANRFGFVYTAGLTATFSNSPVFGTFAFADTSGIISNYSMTFTNGGTVTGKRYEADSNAIIQALGGATYLPGNSAGTTSTGGQYI